MELYPKVSQRKGGLFLENNTQCISLLAQNAPGVFGRVLSCIRNEGWNINRLSAEVCQNEAFSHMEMEIEGKHSKLALVAEHMLRLDCVLRVTMNGVVSEKKTVLPLRDTEEKELFVVPVREKEPGVLRILTVNPGSTSTKFALYDNECAVLEQVVRHRSEELAGEVHEQKEFRKHCIVSYLEKAGLCMSSLDAIAGRGGLLHPMASGTYLVNKKMLEDLRSAAASVHASALGAIIASELAVQHQKPAYVVDPIVVDEMDRHAKLTGIPGIERHSVFHALNQKAVARRLSNEMGKSYENCRFVVAHLGGGISVGAHRYGRVIDVNDAFDGEGPFTPERSGHVPALPLIDLCFSGEYTKTEMVEKVVCQGGIASYLGTNDLRTVEKMIANGDEFASLLLDSMAYQVAKEIGAMCAALEGRVDAVILTGGLAYSTRFISNIKQRVDRLAEVYVFPGEDETLALTQGTLRVLRGEECALVYEG